MNIRIGKASTRLGIHPATLRDLENRGLIPPARRDWSGYRVYSDDELKQIETVLFAQPGMRRRHERAA